MIPSPHCNKSFNPHQRIEVVVKEKSDGLVTQLVGTCKVCGKARHYTETMKSEFSTPVISSNALRNIK